MFDTKFAALKNKKNIIIIKVEELLNMDVIFERFFRILGIKRY